MDLGPARDRLVHLGTRKRRVTFSIRELNRRTVEAVAHLLSDGEATTLRLAASRVTQPFLFEADDPGDRARRALERDDLDAARRVRVREVAADVEIRRRSTGHRMEPEYARLNHPGRFAAGWRAWCPTYAARRRGLEPEPADPAPDEWDRAEASFGDERTTWRELLAVLGKRVDTLLDAEPETLE
ncbi:MAG: hypothetical protein GY715_06450 [Planctomycetes bacterium]|nr:hypothetical protein [Planctomycetota bacterium]